MDNLRGGDGAVPLGSDCRAEPFSDDTRSGAVSEDLTQPVRPRGGDPQRGCVPFSFN